MAIESCISDWDLTLAELRRRSSKRRRISSEANLPPISNLGEDLLVEILIRSLPDPRSACRCKLVCKRWSSLISSPRFNRRFLSHHQTMSLNLPPMPLDPFELQSIIRSFLPPIPDGVLDTLTVLDCNKDLVLCGFWDLDRYMELGLNEGQRTRSYLVCNPFTKQWIALPLAPRRKNAGCNVEMARLVCEPRISYKLDLGDDQAEFVYSEYRFRVVCIYQVFGQNKAIKLDVFCSESGEWTKEALVCDGRVRAGGKAVFSCNGELFWRYYECRNEQNILVARFNPFRLDMPPTSIDASAFHVKPKWFISCSQGALHIIAVENETAPVRESVWRLEEDGKSWRKQCEGLVNTTSQFCDFDVADCFHPYQHPHEPEIVFYNCTAADDKNKNAILCCDLRREELEFVAELEKSVDRSRFQVFQPRVSSWPTPTPIPRYEELRGMYDGSFSFWVQGSSEAKMPPLPPSLINCMDYLMKSALYKDYIDHVTAEATLHMVAELIRSRKGKISHDIKFLRERQLRSLTLGDEWDVLEADLEDVEVDMSSLVSQKRGLKWALEHEIAVSPYPPEGLMESSYRRVPRRWGENHIMGHIVRGIHPPLERKREGDE